MDDLTSKLAELLQSPEGMDTVRNIASSLMSQQPAKSENENESPQLPISSEQLGTIMQITSLFKDTGSNDEQTKLLISLKPHLSIERQKRVDNAVRILKLIKMLPLIQDSGILSLI